VLKILLDMDGVLTNWEKGVCDLFKLDYEEVVASWPPGEYGIETAAGINEGKVWDAINNAGEDWWANLEEYPWARSFYNDCTAMADTYFVTSPSKHGSSLAGKLTWMQKFTGADDFRNFLVGPKKYLCARPDQVLVDDSDKHINQFRERGGFGILFPRQNNSAWHIIGSPAVYAGAEIQKIHDILKAHMVPKDI